MFDVDVAGSSFALRERLFRGETVGDGVIAEIGEYIARHRLYQGGSPARAIRYALPQPRLLIYPSPANPKAAALAQSFAKYGCEEDPNCVLAIGGDGTMLRAIHEHWRLRVPFLGINAGHLGFLLNNADEILDGAFPPPELIMHPMPLLYVEMELADGTWRTGLTFNDAWVERLTGQTAWLEVSVDGEVRLPKLQCDGLLVSTAAGSTAYAISMGATPLLADTPAWLLVGSNVMQPVKWKSAMLSLDSQVEVRCLDPIKRPLNGFIYGMAVGNVVAHESAGQPHRGRRGRVLPVARHHSENSTNPVGRLKAAATIVSPVSEPQSGAVTPDRASPAGTPGPWARRFYRNRAVGAGTALGLLKFARSPVRTITAYTTRAGPPGRRHAGRKESAG